MPIAAVYTRQSLDKTGKEAGVERQLRECRAKAESLDLPIIHELSDNDTSATTGVKRPGFEKLLKLLAEDSIDTVVVWHTDRLYRKLRDLVRITDLAEKHAVRIVTVKAGELDLNTATGRMMAGILGSVASQEGEHRTDRQKTAFASYAAEGVWHFSHRPFGYSRGPKVRVGGKEVAGPVVQVPAEAAIVREAFERYTKGESHYAIVTSLNERGILTAPGNRWTITQLRTVLNNPRYAGHSLYRGEIVGAGDWKPIISPEQYDAYVTASKSRRTPSTFSRKAASMLSGVIVCAVCGGKCYRVQRGDKLEYAYACSASHCVSMKQEPIDDYVREQVLRAIVVGPRGASQAVEGAASIPKLNADIDALQRRSDDLVESIAAGFTTYAKQKSALTKLSAQRAELAAARNNILASSAAAAIVNDLASTLFKGKQTSIEDAAKLYEQVATRFDSMTLGKQRELVRHYVAVSLGKGRGLGRVHVEHLVALGLNDEVDG
jgi:site-specific DNA recombinase